MARVRSPNYPAISLSAALDRTLILHRAEGKNVMAREAVAKHLGFTSINGASATMISALGKYGLLESAGHGEARISDIAMRILFPHDEQERTAALREAAGRPALFAEIKEKWPDRPPSDESLRSFLVRKGFAQGVLDQVIQIYRETIDIAGLAGVPEDGGRVSSSREASMSTALVPMSDEAPRPKASAAQPASPPAGRPFTVTFDGSVVTGVIAVRTVREMDQLMKVLQAQKAAIEAMQSYADDDHEGDDLSGEDEDWQQ